MLSVIHGVINSDNNLQLPCCLKSLATSYEFEKKITSLPCTI